VPRFYNTATSNCTTLVFDLVRVVHPGLPLDYRVVLAGYLADYAYTAGALDTEMPSRDCANSPKSMTGLSGPTRMLIFQREYAKASRNPHDVLCLRYESFQVPSASWQLVSV
jgi:hypothetical protein